MHGLLFRGMGAVFILCIAFPVIKGLGIFTFRAEDSLSQDRRATHVFNALINLRCKLSGTAFNDILQAKLSSDSRNIIPISGRIALTY